MPSPRESTVGDVHIYNCRIISVQMSLCSIIVNRWMAMMLYRVVVIYYHHYYYRYCCCCCCQQSSFSMTRGQLAIISLLYLTLWILSIRRALSLQLLTSMHYRGGWDCCCTVVGMMTPRHSLEGSHSWLFINSSMKYYLYCILREAKQMFAAILSSHYPAKIYDHA